MASLTDNVSTMLAYANDVSYDEIFVEQLKNFFSAGDVVVGISASGNSLNVIKAVDYAKTKGGVTVGLCGYSGGKLYHMVDIPLLVKINDMQKVEDVHMIVVHMTMRRILEELNHVALE
jgi:D-sedoheptulose 7-phosphate isomerase